MIGFLPNITIIKHLQRRIRWKKKENIWDFFP